jgi:CRP-like cAMP-binding protein
MSVAGVDSDILAKLPIFEGLTADECQQLAEIAIPADFRTGETIIEQGTSSQVLWIVLEGTCEVLMRFSGDHAPHAPTVLAELGPASNFGEMSFFHRAPHSASVRAKTDVKLLRIEREKFDALIPLEGNAACKVALNTIETLADRLRRMGQWVAELTVEKAPHRKEPEWNQLRAKMFDGWKL